MENSSILPQTWEWLKLSDVITTVKGKKPKNLGSKNNQYPIPYINIEAFEKGIVTQYTDGFGVRYCQPNDILIVWDGARCGLVGWKANGAIGSTLAKLEFKKFIPSFVYYFLQSQYETINKNPRGIGIPHIDPNIFWNIDIPVPTIIEQELIVAKIEELFSQLDTGTTALKRVQTGLKRYKASVLKAAYEGRLVCEDNEEGPSPEKWRWTMLGDIGKISGGVTKNSRRNELPLKLPYIRVANVYANELRLNQIEYMGIKEEEVQRTLLEEGDLLVVEGNGSADQIGRVAIWNGYIAPCLHQNHIIKVRFDQKITGRYVLYWLLSDGGREQINSVASSTSGLYTLNLSKVANLVIPLAPIGEQGRIVDEIERRFSICKEIEKSAIDATMYSVLLRQSILQKAFEGELL